MRSSVFIFVHGYTVTERGRPTTRVWEDRLNAAEKTARTYNGLGVEDITILFVEDRGMTKETLLTYAQEQKHPVIEEYEVRYTSRKPQMNTQDEILSVCEFIRETTPLPAVVVSVSSLDHTPRIMRYWTEVKSGGALPDPVVATVVGSEEPYTLDGGSPITLERSKYKELCMALDNIFDIPDEHVPQVSEEVETCIQNYLDSDPSGPYSYPYDSGS